MSNVRCPTNLKQQKTKIQGSKARKTLNINESDNELLSLLHCQCSALEEIIQRKRNNNNARNNSLWIYFCDDNDDLQVAFSTNLRNEKSKCCKGGKENCKIKTPPLFWAQEKLKAT